ncbi:uncharacterized protein BDW43DRAFT_260555 [Aspergillus alliaceus]|uniref:uncharacterized protein n=1 Tax=Petromyces alliaceus TaxID=209559 RepID=UPI0012A77BD7|nr:uncharacterized protein BDW43DRAFT_260555 [Aspergillus alliaceus]KAB8239099.1 hypothetical protein BDW43DRAFT_260555 [Aspergillus alliaceus]
MNVYPCSMPFRVKKGNLIWSTLRNKTLLSLPCLSRRDLISLSLIPEYPGRVQAVKRPNNGLVDILDDSKSKEEIDIPMIGNRIWQQISRRTPLPIDPR